MRLRRMLLADGSGTTTAVRHGDAWVALAPALDALGDAALESALGRARDDVVAFLAAGDAARDAARELIERVDRPAALDPRPLLPFQPRSFRDFSIWEEHMTRAARVMARRFLPPPVSRLASGFERATRRTFPAFKPKSGFFEHPIFYVGNHLAFYPDGSPIPWPRASEWFDFELELGFVLAQPVHDCDSAAGEAAIGGFFVLNDWSARDVQAHDYRTHPLTQVSKAKSTANSVSAEVVTADEVVPRWSSLTATAAVNDETWCTGSTRGPQHDLGDMVAYASRDEYLLPGEVLATGTLPGCCGLELDRWVGRGDEVELSIEGVGTLRNRIGEDVAPPCA
jgi:2-keto-4-pentenoate hydratase/2-oxohepta-3-ene-1,7-dioic acid hydratase in catechol pathway